MTQFQGDTLVWTCIWTIYNVLEVYLAGMFCINSCFLFPHIARYAGYAYA